MHLSRFGGTRAVSPLVRACEPRMHESLGAVECGEEIARGRQTTSAEAVEYALALLARDVDEC